jgi:pimeloyl-ACP methyl ester carboxylesterase
VVTRIVRGEEDQLVPAREAASLAESAGTRVVAIPDAGHSFPAERPEEFAGVLDSFLEKEERRRQERTD